MYLEISPRRSGKTNRLVTDLVKHLNKDKYNHKVLLIVPTWTMKRYYINYLGNLEVDMSRVEIFTIYDHSLYFTKIYVDEFDHCDFEFPLDLNGGYYVTTPARVRSRNELETSDNTICTMLRENDYKYVMHKTRISPSSYSSQDLQTIDLEFKNKFYSYDEGVTLAIESVDNSSLIHCQLRFDESKIGTLV